jgi:hypothetical protein
MNFFPFMVAGLLALVAVMWAGLDDPSTKPPVESSTHLATHPIAPILETRS